MLYITQHANIMYINKIQLTILISNQIVQLEEIDQT